MTTTFVPGLLDTSSRANLNFLCLCVLCDGCLLAVFFGYFNLFAGMQRQFQQGSSLRDSQSRDLGRTEGCAYRTLAILYLNTIAKGFTPKDKTLESANILETSKMHLHETLNALYYSPTKSPANGSRLRT